MRGQISRASFRPECHYSGVYQQQGRMITDADVNEAVEIGKARDEAAIGLAVGSGAPEAGGLVRLEHCTVLGPIVCARLQASDSILLGEVTIAGGGASCVRYSRIPAALAAAPPSGLALMRNTTDSPVFFADAFGRWGSGVLHPATSWRILEGAEDGGEQGAFHRRAYALALDALEQKLLELMPLGIEAVLIPDPRLSCRPPVLVTDGG